MEPCQRGVYIVPYTVSSDSARPFPVPEALDTPAPAVEAWQIQPVPDPEYCVKGRDYVLPPAAGETEREPGIYELGAGTAQEALQTSQDLDFGFAQLMQGLLHVSQSTVWECPDPEYSAGDREALLQMYQGRVMPSAFEGVDLFEPSAAGDAAQQSMQLHDAWARQWVSRHFRTLTPYVRSAAEALTGEFYEKLSGRLGGANKFRLTLPELCRWLMRDPVLQQEFATCLQIYMTSMDQLRTGRNPSYGTMNRVLQQKQQSYSRLGAFLLKRLAYMKATVGDAEGSVHLQCWGPLWLDWHGVAKQMKAVYAQPRALRQNTFAGMSTARNHVPPWRVGRI